MPDWIAVIILGIIEGLTEFLPVSSTGHLLIADRWIHAGVTKTELFKVVIQCGAVMAVLLVFSKRAKELLMSSRDPATRGYLMKLAWAFGITAAGGLVLKKVLHWKLPETVFPVAMATLIGGVVILVIERWLRDRPTVAEMSWAAATAVGCAQLLAATCPGTSRSGACILFALALGISRPAATEFSFLVGIPTMFAASGLEILSELKAGSTLTSSDWMLVGLGTLVSAISAFLVVRWLLRFVQSHTFVGFGWYRIVLGTVLILWLGRGA